MNAHQLVATTLLAVAATACGGDDRTMMSDYTQNLGRHLDALRTEQSAHASEMSAVSNLDVVRDREPGHWERMNGHMDQMNLALGDMMSCRDARGMPFDGAGFAGMMHDLRSEGDEHETKMLGASSLDLALAEESRHEDTIGLQMFEIQGQWNTMMEESRAYTCPHCQHCGM
jgi:hypothetical protein